MAVLWVTTLIFGENKMAGRTTISAKQYSFQVIFLCTDGFNSEIIPRGRMQRQILINVNIFVAYVLNLPLNAQRPHYRPKRAGKWNLILAQHRRPIYRQCLDPTNREISRIHCIKGRVMCEADKCITDIFHIIGWCARCMCRTYYDFHIVFEASFGCGKLFYYCSLHTVNGYIFPPDQRFGVIAVIFVAC